MHVRHGCRVALAGLLAGVLLAGCDGGGSDPSSSSTAASTSGSTTSTSSTSSSSSPSSSPSGSAYVPLKPEFPAAAKKQTLQSAEAFARYFYELLNYAYTKPEGGLVSPLSESGCRPCSAFEAESDSLARDGRRYASEVLTIKHVIFTTEDIDNPWVTVSGHQNEVPIIEKDGTLTSAAPAEDVTFRVVLRWTSSGWRVEDLVSV